MLFINFLIWKLSRQIKDEVNKLHYTRQGLINDIEARKHKISILDMTAFSCEQDYKRTQQRVQELGDKKDKIEKLIANILNGEDYSKLRQIVKENVKAVVSENKSLISISFAALIQTMKADPQMVKLIQNMPSANDGERYKNNDNNIIKYVESNKNSLLDLAEKHYENLVKALTNNVIDTIASNPRSSLHYQSSTFPSQPNYTDIYGIEKPKTYNNNKGDIVD